MNTHNIPRALGFTLIELLIVVTIVLALASIVTPSFFSMADDSKIVVANTTVKNIQKKIRAHYELNGAWPQEIDRAWFVDKRYPKNPFYPNYDGDTSNYQNIENKWHPSYKAIQSYPPFWYNRANGSFRIRVPEQETDAQTLELYNKANISAINSLDDIVGQY